MVQISLDRKGIELPANWSWLRRDSCRPLVLLTGCAGFVGFHVTTRLLENGLSVIGLDNLNSYYDVSLKRTRLSRLQERPHFSFYQMDLQDGDSLKRLFLSERPALVINLAAQAGVRHSIEDPSSYIDANIVGFLNVLEGCRHTDVEHLIYASSSSVYGANAKIPFSVHDNVDHPVSLYAATKKAGELMAHAYSHLYGLPATGLRLFTVYGPWGRPDMAYFRFTKAILEDRPIQVFNYGRMRRDFTYIDDVVEAVVRLIDKRPKPNPEWDPTNPDPASSLAPHRIYNIGNSQPVELGRFIEVLEEALGKKARKEYLPMQAGDVIETYADTKDLITEIGYEPHTPIEEGIPRFVDWYRDYYQVG